MDWADKAAAVILDPLVQRDNPISRQDYIYLGTNIAQLARIIKATYLSPDSSLPDEEDE